MSTVTDGIIGALIGAVAAIIVAIISYVGLVKKDYVSLDKGISEKLNNISGKNDMLSMEHQQLKEYQGEIRNAVNFLKEKAFVEQGTKDALSREVLDIKQTSDHIAALVNFLQIAQEDNARLTQENMQLRDRLREYEQQRYKGNEMEL